MDEIIESCSGIGEYAHRTIRLTVVASGRFGNHGCDALFVPVGRPEVAVVHREGEAARPAHQARKLPAADKAVQNSPSSAGNRSTFAEGQLSNPVGIDLVSGI